MAAMQLKVFLAGVGIAAAVAFSVSPGYAQSFTCSFGDRAACLGYGDTVCSSTGKCVSSDAQCFERYQCDYEGFTCKSNVTACASEYDDLLARRNSLAEEYNELLASHKELIESHDALVTRFNGLLEDHRKLAIQFDDLTAAASGIAGCVEGAETADEARDCIY